MDADSGKILYNTKWSEIIEWPENKVIKLYKAGFEHKAQREIKVNMILTNRLPKPKYFGSIEFRGRTGLIFEKIEGLTLVNELYKTPFKIFSYSCQLAILHHLIQQQKSSELPDLKEELTRRILKAKIETEIQEYALQKVEKLPQKNNVCHGDLNLSNIIKSKKGFIVVDWAASTKGDPAADIARNINNLSLTNTNFFRHTSRTLFWKTYLKHFSNLKPGIEKRVSDWRLPVALSSFGVIEDSSSSKFAAYKKLIRRYYKNESR
jgi:tRNA A-37 threonylcarbamoyl transferase component Bud32